MPRPIKAAKHRRKDHNLYGQHGGPMVPPTPPQPTELLAFMMSWAKRWEWDGFKPLPEGYTRVPLFGTHQQDSYPWSPEPMREPPPSVGTTPAATLQPVPFSLWDPVTGYMMVGCSPRGWSPADVVDEVEAYFAWVEPYATALHPDWEPTWVRTQLHPGRPLKSIQDRYQANTVQWAGARLPTHPQTDRTVSGA